MQGNKNSNKSKENPPSEHMQQIQLEPSRNLPANNYQQNSEIATPTKTKMHQKSSHRSQINKIRQPEQNAPSEQSNNKSNSNLNQSNVQADNRFSRQNLSKNHHIELQSNKFENQKKNTPSEHSTTSSNIV